MVRQRSKIECRVMTDDQSRLGNLTIAVKVLHPVQSFFDKLLHGHALNAVLLCILFYIIDFFLGINIEIGVVEHSFPPTIIHFLDREFPA
jgi:hypothetical protein